MGSPRKLCVFFPTFFVFNDVDFPPTPKQVPAIAIFYIRSTKLCFPWDVDSLTIIGMKKTGYEHRRPG